VHGDAPPMKKPRKVLSREQLLPLPAAMVRSILLEYHLAFDALVRGHGDETMAYKLVHMTGHAWYLMAPGERPCEVHDAAQNALIAVIKRGEAGAGWTLETSEHEALQQLLLAHERQLLELPRYRIEAALQRIARIETENARKAARLACTTDPQTDRVPQP
jgi:hypothetical protein